MNIIDEHITLSNEKVHVNNAYQKKIDNKI